MPTNAPALKGIRPGGTAPDDFKPHAPEPWTVDALCTEKCRADWFAAGHLAELARALCASCPVRQRCLESAIERDEQHGIWGGVRFPLTLTCGGKHVPTWVSRPKRNNPDYMRCLVCERESQARRRALRKERIANAQPTPGSGPL